MNEQLQQALTAILNKTMQGVDTGVSFLSSQMPDVISQLLMWEMAQAGIGLSIILLVVVISSFSARWATKVFAKYNEGYYLFIRNHGNEEEKKRGQIMRDEAGQLIPWAVISVAVCVFSWLALFMGGIPMLMKMIQIWLAPKIYLIEYAASLTK